MEENINIKDLYNVLKKRLLLIVAITISALLISAFFTFFIATPKYEASTQILVNQAQVGEQPITANELESNLEFINTYSVIISSPAILEQVIEESNTTNSIEELQEQITVAAENESQVATLIVEDANPETAVNLANTIAEVFEREILDIMTVDNVSILSQAQLSAEPTPVSPQPIINLGIALIIGFLIGIGTAFLLEFLDKSIKSEQDVEKYLGLPILGAVPIMSAADLNDNKSKNANSTTSNRASRKDNKERKTS